jgi:hypothetical protein
VQRAGAVVAGLAHEPVTVAGDARVDGVHELADAGQVVDERELADGA